MRGVCAAEWVHRGSGLCVGGGEGVGFEGGVLLGRGGREAGV